MPRDPNENYWNPYRWVRVSDQPVQRAAPSYQHQFSGLGGRIECELEALTPLIIGDGKSEIGFVRHGTTPFIPATSLKGAIRSVAELIGNAAVPSDKGHADAGHKADQASDGQGSNWQVDIVARTFGHLDNRRTFTGLVRFSDAPLKGDTVPAIGPFKVASGQPDPKHRAFYPDHKRRKLYHHRPGATDLVAPPAGIVEKQKRTVRPLPPGSTFQFTVDFFNLRDEELNLLLYCLVLEDEVSVTLSPQALGAEAREPVTFTGPLRHKLGGCKPQGAGSSQVRVARLVVRRDAAARYRGQSAEAVFTEQALAEELARRTESFRRRADTTMQEFRAMAIYSANDPRRTLSYPSFQWFREPGNSDTPLKPTM